MPTRLIAQNAPDILIPLAQKWLEEGKSFYLGPETMFMNGQKPVNYAGDPGISRDWNWFIHTDDYATPTTELKKEEIEDLAHHLSLFSFPQYAMLYVDYTCNSNCFMCTYHGSEREQGDLPWVRSSFWPTHQHMRLRITPEEAMARVDLLSQFGFQQLSLQSLGEILVYPGWQKVLHYAAGKGFATNITTNGMALNEATCEQLAGHGLNGIIISVNAASQETFTRISGVTRSDAFSNVWNGPLLMKEKYHLPYVGVSFVYNEYNRHELKPFLDYWTRQPVDDLRVIYVNRESETVRVNSHREEPMGICSAQHAQLIILPSGQLLPCCPAFWPYDDANSFNLPVHYLDENLPATICAMKHEWFLDSWRNACSHCASYERGGQHWPVEIHGHRGWQHGRVVRFRCGSSSIVGNF